MLAACSQGVFSELPAATWDNMAFEFKLARYFRPVTLDLVRTQWSPHHVVLTIAFCHLLKLSWAWVNFVNSIEMCPNLTYVGNEEFLTQFFWRLSYNETVLVSWATEGMVVQNYCFSRPVKNKQGNRSMIGIGKSDWPSADYTKEPWGQSKCFANGYDGRGVNMRRWICWDGVNIGQWIWWKGGKGQSKCSARVDTQLWSSAAHDSPSIVTLVNSLKAWFRWK